MAGFLTAAAAAIGSSSIGSALVRILVAYGVSKLINRATGLDNSAAQSDEGVRLQLAPDTTNPIPLVFGSAYLGGKITDAQIADANQTMWYCLTVAEVPTHARLSDSAAIVTSFDEIYWNNQRVYFQADGVTIDYLVNQDGVVDTSARGLVKIYLYRNGSADPTLPSDLGDYLSTLPSVPNAAHTYMPGWTTATTMTNLSFALVKISYNRDKSITGLQDIRFKLSNNLFKPGDAIYSYMRNPVSGLGFEDTQIDTASLTALNDYADDTVSYLDEADNTVKTLANRYQINGVVNPTDNVMNNLQKLASNTGCFVNYDIGTGLWGVTINRDIAPTLAFDDSNIISGIDLTGTNLDNMYNAVEIEFPHRQLRDQIDVIRIDLPAEFRNANEPDNILKIRLDLLNEPLQARELGYLELYQNRMDQVITFTSDYSKINTEAGDVITVTNSIYGWTNQPFRVVRVREVEGDDGGLAVEITAQEYDATMYTAGGQPRRPRVPSEAIGIPGIAVIGTPDTPTTTLINLVAVPAIDITALTPSGIVDVLEFWYSADVGVTYRLLGTRRNSNGAPYNEDTSLTFRAANLAAGDYLFKVRGGNATAFGAFSAPTATVSWAPVQVTDAVSDTTQVTGSMADLIGPLAMGAVAYFAYQQLYPEIMGALGDSALGEIFGIPSSAVQTMQNASGNFKIIQVGDSIQTPYTNDTITFIAGDGITIEAEADAGTITIKSTVTDAFKTFTVGTDVIEANPESTNVTFTNGAGIVIEAFPDTNTIKITADASVLEPTDDFNTDKAVDFGTINSTNTYKMDDCGVSVLKAPKLKRRPGVYENTRAYITGGSTWASDCYGTSMPTLIIPKHGTAVNPTIHPLTQGSFTLNTVSGHPLQGKRVYYRAVTPAQVIAYCNFDDAGNTLPIPGSSCSIEPPSARPVFSTREFPAGNRFVTYSMIQAWCLAAGGYGYPINTLTYTTVTSNEYYAQNHEITQQARICQNADKSEPSYAF